MTKNEQQALRYLLQNYNTTVRFCLICNYVSRIDEGLQNEFIRLRFNQLPKDEIIKFLKHISISEKLNLSDESLVSIQNLYKSDMRSMINFMQTNQDIVQSNNSIISLNNSNQYNIINSLIWESIISKMKTKESLEKLANYVQFISVKYNVDKKYIINEFLNYIIRNKSEFVTTDILDFIENIMHSQISDTNIYVNYALSKLSCFISS